MNILRSDRQLAGDDLLIACRKTADLYQDAAQHLSSEAAAAVLRAIAAQRERIAIAIEDAFHDCGELPPAVDPEREGIEKIVNRFRAAVSSDNIGELLQQRLDTEEYLQVLLGDIEARELPERFRPLLQQLRDHSGVAADRLRELLRIHAQEPEV